MVCWIHRSTKLSTAIIVMLIHYITNVSTSCNISSSFTDGLPSYQVFQQHKSKGAHFIKFWINIETTSSAQVSRLSLVGNDTFDPALWAWAENAGKYMLRLPLDSDLLSLGMLALHEANMDITITEEPENCLSSLTTDELWDKIASHLLYSVISTPNSNQVLEEEVVCRSAFTFQHYFYSSVNGAGFKCCQSNSVNTNSSQLVTCETSYSEGWHLIWFGPLGMLLLLYILMIIIIYRNTKQLKRLKKEGSNGIFLVEYFTNDFKNELVDTLVRSGSSFALTKDIREFLSLHEPVVMLDVLGISKKHQSHITRFLQVMSMAIMIICYYLYVAMSFYYYSTLQQEILLLQRNSDLYVNIFGHIGWIYSNGNLALKYYAIFEVSITAIIPPLLLFNYLALKQYRTNKEEEMAGDRGASNNNEDIDTTSTNKPENEETVVADGGHNSKKSCFSRLINSTFGTALQLVSFAVILLYAVCIASVYFVYCCFLTFLGLFVSMDILGTWLIPMFIFIFYLTVAFNPVKKYYKLTKQKLFTTCKECTTRSDLLLGDENRDFVLPRRLMEEFYIPRSRDKIWSTVQRIVSAITVLLLIFLVLLSVQYPSMNLNTSGSSILGVNIIILLPFIGGAVFDNQLSDQENELLSFDLKQFVTNWKVDKIIPSLIPMTTSKKPGKSKNKISAKDETVNDKVNGENKNKSKYIESVDGLDDKLVPKPHILEPISTLTSKVG